jgi:hypothetical protein
MTMEGKDDFVLNIPHINIALKLIILPTELPITRRFIFK